MTKLIGFFFDNAWGKAAAFAAGFLSLVMWFASEQRQIGGERAVTNINQATDNAVTLGRAAADKSRAGTGGVRRKLDPTTRND